MMGTSSLEETALSLVRSNHFHCNWVGHMHSRKAGVVLFRIMSLKSDVFPKVDGFGRSNKRFAIYDCVDPQLSPPVAIAFLLHPAGYKYIKDTNDVGYPVEPADKPSSLLR